ncbi:hypothetical protein Pyn_23535 [Prunus yedoensis var. nudiflora]|uniref:Uncharacterized protein n=1 Tax=Prunus yedoensis var. nudiflora TaxID=2094558 RepID=A0A314YR98_PRUYE|nr:hypothetical protein Pyn_23535 [Prunus yedoensis var. nudiflora]
MFTKKQPDVPPRSSTSTNYSITNYGQPKAKASLRPRSREGRVATLARAVTPATVSGRHSGHGKRSPFRPWQRSSLKSWQRLSLGTW